METTLDTVTDEVQLVCFRLNQEEYAFNIMQVQEIIRLRDVTSVPNTKEYVEGIINLRGAIVPIVDMRRRFGLNQEDRTEQNRIVISHINGMIIGFIVDAVSEVLRISRRSVEPPPEAISGVQSQFIDGVGKLNEGQRMLIMVNLDSLMSDYARAA
jgi:purine-binding chemotaxis protein CheW